MTLRAYVALILSILMFQPAHALKLGFLKHSVLNELSESEIDSFKALINKSLDSLEDRDVLKWNNEEQSIEGQLKVMFSYSMGKISCKRARLYLISDGKKVPWQMNLCKQDGRWQIMQTPLTLLSDDDFTALQTTLVSLLNDAPLGASIFWQAEDSKVGGTLAVIKEFKITKRLCRRALISLKSDDNKMLNGQYDFCRKQEADKWFRYVSEAR